MGKQPNILIILSDDMGYSDIGCYGGEIETPNLNRLAENGLRFTQFYNTARCSPSRASLLTGLHPHQTGIGILTDDDSLDGGYPGNLNRRCVTIAELLKDNGYRTYMSGKWHLAHEMENINDTWPKQRGFDRFYGTIVGAGSYYDPITLTRDNTNIEEEPKQDSDFYYTDAISDNAAEFIKSHANESKNKPFFCYVAYTAPHWPLHAREEDITKYKGYFDEGWDKLRQKRLERMKEMGILGESCELSSRDSSQQEWDLADEKEWRLRCMEVYAAQIDVMDRGIGRIIDALEETGELDNTMIMFLSDNGGCAEPIVDAAASRMVEHDKVSRSQTRSGEPIHFANHHEIMPGSENTYQSYGVAWANLSNTPFRLYKHFTHEGGISTPLIMHWPDEIKKKGVLRHSPAQLTDIMATVLEVTGVKYPSQFKGNEILPLEGTSMVPLFTKDEYNRGPLFWEHEGNAAMRMGKWKIVRKYPGDWELYDIVVDRSELINLANKYPDRVSEMKECYEQWEKKCNIIPAEKALEAAKLRNKRMGLENIDWKELSIQK